MSAIITTSDPVTMDMPDATPGKAMASIVFYECPNGTMSIEPMHVGEFDPNIQQHRILQLICDFLPQIVSPVNMENIALSIASDADDTQENSLH